MVSMDKMSYKEKFIQMNEEAKWTWIITIILIVFWFITGFGLYAVAPEAMLFNGPAWFFVSCFGSWILSIILVVWLVKSKFKDFPLDDDGEEVTK